MTDYLLLFYTAEDTKTIFLLSILKPEYDGYRHRFMTQFIGEPLQNLTQAAKNVPYARVFVD